MKTDIKDMKDMKDILKFTKAIERDIHEPDKILCHTAQIRYSLLRLGIKTEDK